MRTCNISSSPKEYMHVRAGREPNTAKSLFFLGWMGPWDTNRLRHILPPCAWFVRISLIGTHLPLKTWPWQHPVPLVDLKWTKPSFLTFSASTPGNLVLSPRAADAIAKGWEPHSLHSLLSLRCWWCHFLPQRKPSAAAGPELRFWQVREAGTYFWI